MDDEQRQQVVAGQRAALSHGEVTWDQGSLAGPAKAVGWVGYRDISTRTPISPFVQQRTSGAGEVCLIVVPDVDEPLTDQHVIEIPFHRIIEVRYIPYMP